MKLSPNLFLFSLLAFAVPLQAAPSKPRHSLSPALVDKLKNLPHGLSNQKSLFVRFKHVESVRFFGAGHHGRFTFQRGYSLVPEGLSLLLTNNSRENWAAGVVQFKRPLDVSKYNSLVVWAWASQPETRIWLGLKSHAASKKSTHVLPARTDVLPLQGFPPGEPAQLIVPLNRFFSKPKIDLTKVSQITFEFGKRTVGNPDLGEIDILGFAFVEQSPALKRARLVLMRPRPRLAPPVPSPSPVQITAPAEAQALLKMSEAETAEYFKQKGLAIARPSEPVETESAEPPKTFTRDWIQPYSRGWPGDAAAVVEPATEERSEWIEFWYYVLLGGLCVVWFLALRRRKPAAVSRLDGVLHEIRWPFQSAEPSKKGKVEREFWKDVASQDVRVGWLSVTGLTKEKGGSSDYFGEAFLLRQVGLAAEAGIRLFPSFSFTNSLLRKNTLLSNPHRSSSALRTLATETILRFADKAAGIRIEDAAAFLNEKFWTEVIRAVKAKRPNFIFIADRVGAHAAFIREAGFDYFENDAFIESLSAQIRQARPNDLAAFPMKHSIFNITTLLRGPFKNEIEQRQDSLIALVVSLLPGVLQHDDNLPDDLERFIDRILRTPALKNGEFGMLGTNSYSALAFARWQKKFLYVAVANFSPETCDVTVRLDPVHEGLEKNKLYLFSNALHGIPPLKNFLNQADLSGPALALWGQSLRDMGLPLTLPGLSLNLFSVSLSRPIVSGSSASGVSESAVPASVQ